MPKVSVFLTSYNHGEFIYESIDSILKQTFSDFELVIVDDCSTDNSWDIICSFDDRRIRKIRHSTNLGSCSSKELIHSLRGEYIAIAHCDDKWREDKLEKQVKYLDLNSNTYACFTKVQLINELNENFEDEKHYFYNIFEQENRSRFKWLNYFIYYGNCLCHPSLLIRKEAYFKFNLFTIGLYSIPDYLKWIRICFHHDIHIFPERLTFFRVRSSGGNTSSDSETNRKRMRFEEFVVLEEYKKSLNEKNILEIFPDCKRYIVDNKMNYLFAFYKTLQKEENRKTYQLFALKGLYELLNSDESKNIEKLYSYTSKTFKQESCKYDIFGEIKRDNLMCSTLFFDKGEGFNSNDALTKNVFTNLQDGFVIKYVINIENCLGKFRFDPDEGVFRKFKNIVIEVNGFIVKYTNNKHIDVDDWDVFYTTDPNYFFSVESADCYEITITGFSNQIDLGIIDLYIKDLENNQKKSLFSRKKN